MLLNSDIVSCFGTESFEKSTDISESDFSIDEHEVVIKPQDELAEQLVVYKGNSTLSTRG